LSRSAAIFLASLFLFVLFATYLQLSFHIFELHHHDDLGMDRQKLLMVLAPPSKLKVNVIRPGANRTEAGETQRLFSRPGERGAAVVAPLPDMNTVSSIPHRLIFTFKTNILDTRAPLRFYENVQNTIQHYRRAWADTDNKTNSSTMEVWFLDNGACRDVLRDVGGGPELVHHFDAETRGAFKADLCRIAALLARGGYYMDIDMKTLQPFVLNDGTTFSSVWMPGRRGFFQSFCASTPNHPVVKRALDLMVRYYRERADVQRVIASQDFTKPLDAESRRVFDGIQQQSVVSNSSAREQQQQAGISAEAVNGVNDNGIIHNNKRRNPSLSELRDAYETLGESIRDVWSPEEQRRILGALANQLHLSQRVPSGLIGPSTLLDAYDQKLQEDPDLASRCSFLEELNLEEDVDHLYPDLPRQDGLGGACNYVVHDPALRRVYFYSRFVGASDRCLSMDTVKRRIHYDDNKNGKQL